MSRDDIHSRIDELLGLISIHNNRLSLHTEKLSQLDIDVLRKQCIDLYDQVNMLALQGKITVKNNQPKVKEAVVQSLEEQVVEQKVTVVEDDTPKPKQEVTKKPEPMKVKTKKKPKEEEEMLSLFEKFSSKPISSIPKAISVAKRFEFQSEFFDGDGKAYNTFMAELDSAETRDDAFKVYHTAKSKYSWENDELRDELKALMYRKHA